MSVSGSWPAERVPPEIGRCCPGQQPERRKDRCHQPCSSVLCQTMEGNAPRSTVRLCSDLEGRTQDGGRYCTDIFRSRPSIESGFPEFSCRSIVCSASLTFSPALQGSLPGRGSHAIHLEPIALLFCARGCRESGMNANVSIQYIAFCLLPEHVSKQLYQHACFSSISTSVSLLLCRDRWHLAPPRPCQEIGGIA